MRKEKNSVETASLLQKAERKINSENGIKSLAYTNDGIHKLVHELQVHQIELEMQNEQLLIAEEEARTNAEKYCRLYDFFPAGYYTLTQNGTINELNLIGAKMLGHERGNLINQNFKSFLTFYARPIFDNFLNEIFVQNTRQSCEVRLIIEGKPSSFVHLEGLVSEDNTRCLVTAVDITAYKEGTENLRESEIRYHRLFESARDGILILDAVSGQIIDANPFIVQLLGYSYEELQGRELWEIGTFKDIGYSKFAFTELQLRGDIRYEDMPLETKTGKSISVEFISNVYLSDHEKVIQCNIRDITERKRVDKALKENETRLKELNATKDKFFSILAHDLRGPFNSIMGFSDLLVERTSEKDYAEVEKYAGIIQESSRRAMELITNLLDWSRSKIGRMEFSPENFDMAALIKSVSQLLSNSAQQKSITIYMEVPKIVSVFADKAMIGTIVRNLISNAIKFTHPDGEIVISVQLEQDQLIVMVADNGVGMKKGAIDKFFAIEENHSTPGTKGEKGTGLGLILCKEFIKKHGGEIRVESEVGKGSKFYFNIPQNLENVLHKSQQNSGQ